MPVSWPLLLKAVCHYRLVFLKWCRALGISSPLTTDSLMVAPAPYCILGDSGLKSILLQMQFWTRT